MTSTDTDSGSQSVSTLNIANVVAYFLNALVVFGVDYFGIFPSNAEISREYQTLVTPAPYAFSIWGVIFIAELVFVLVQLTRPYRSSDVVVNGIGYGFVAACIAQAAWAVTFGAERIVLSMVAMALILAALLAVVRRSSAIHAGSVLRYWILKFPFQIHAGWIIAAALVNVNVMLVFLKVSRDAQLVVAWASLIAVVLASIYYILRRIWVVPCVLAWASYAISVELKDPLDSIEAQFTGTEVSRLQQASLVLSFVILVGVVIGAVLAHVRKDNDGNDGNGYRSANERTNLVNDD